MGTYIKYKRVEELLTVNELEKLLDSFIIHGWEIIYYHEKDAISYGNSILDNEIIRKIPVTIILGRENKML